jgi:hypothetical protein
MKTESFANSTEGFIGCEGQIRAKRAGNLLAGGGAKLAVDSSAESVETDFLTDGEAGEPAGVGRATIGGSPTVLTWYLGEAKTIKEVGLYTFNGDTRANQDYEVRFFNNASQPGVRPKFRDTPDLSTGPKVIGADGGGYHSSFIDSTGGPLTAEKVDWIEVRIWGCLRDPCRRTGQAADDGRLVRVHRNRSLGRSTRSDPAVARGDRLPGSGPASTSGTGADQANRLAPVADRHTRSNSELGTGTRPSGDVQRPGHPGTVVRLGPAGGRQRSRQATGTGQASRSDRKRGRPRRPGDHLAAARRFPGWAAHRSDRPPRRGGRRRGVLVPRGGLASGLPKGSLDRASVRQ